MILLQQPGSGAGRTLDVEELREIVAELIAAYSEPDLQRRDPVVGWWMIRVGEGGDIYGCFLKWWQFSPQIIPWINRVFHEINHPFLGYHHFRKPPYGERMKMGLEDGKSL